MALSSKSLAGPGYIILNVIRALNIIGLLMVIAACVVMLVKTTVHSQFFFFDAVSHVFMAIMGMFLLASEMSLFRNYFARNWPLLSPAHGFVTLAFAMILIGIDMLGNLNDPSESRKVLGMAFWQLAISSGIVIFILGWINLLASFIFRDRANGVTARQVRAHGAVAAQKSPMSVHSGSSVHQYHYNGGTPKSAPELAQSYISNPRTPTRAPASMGNNAFRILTGGGGNADNDHRNSGLPAYQSTSSPTKSPTSKEAEDDLGRPISPSSRYSRATACTKKKVFGFMGGRNRNSLAPPLPVNASSNFTGNNNNSSRPMEISSPIGVNPAYAHLVARPDSALHPSRTGESDPFRWRPAGSAA